MEEKIEKLTRDAIRNLHLEDIDFALEHPEDLKNGDYSVNAAIILSHRLKISPKELAEKITSEINNSLSNLSGEISKVEAAGAGFINFFLSKKFFAGSIEEILNTKNFAHNDLFSGKNIMIEYTDPNPFKPFHIGHLMTNAIGESVARILEYSGAKVWRANYQGDVGLHVAKAIYGLLKNPEEYMLKDDSIANQASFIGKAYAKGSEDYEKDSSAKTEIDEINKKIYSESDKKINDLYDWGFEVTMEAFEDLYRILGTKFDLYFLESNVAPVGEKIVRANMGKIFEESDGAIVFKAEKYDKDSNSGLHTRVFITSAGLPTYETKELGLTIEKFKIEPTTDLSIVITANEQADYMKVVAKALALIYPEYENKMLHRTHGMMRFGKSSLGKMSSRKGNVITGESLINDARAAILDKIKDRDMSGEEKQKLAGDVGVAVLKYAILKQSTTGDIMYDFEKSISFDGDSGPYLQYSYARANSVLSKAKDENILPDFEILPDEISEVEKLLYRFPEVVLRSSAGYEPHYIANYLIEIARAYNRFYGNTTIVDRNDATSPYKIALTFAFTFIMKSGLHLLGIEAPERM